ncbi:uncharacterized protein LOC112543080 [Python bivittatus]|uniref:Uncharacterized protein LOC112543080 n=1 Tax=Python bivittatus TaxID=176946 RepID=A0A9F5IWQ1_PYTBI|nr:uncharacterized protein LOC112543080 [Python bivittatus]
MGACIPKHIPPTPLSTESLLSAHNSLETGNRESNEMLRACLNHAVQEFHREPQSLRDNATLTIQVRGRKRMEFVSGEGENKIVVSWLKGKTHYHIEISTLEVYLNRLSFSPAPLTSENLEKVRQELARWDNITKELRACLDIAIREIEKEPPSVKGNAELTVECGISCLDFISGKGRSRIHIFFSDKQPHYQVRVSSVDVYLDRLSCRTMLLTTENLMKVWKETEGLKGCTVDLRACLKRALQEFNTLSPRHRANATVFIDCDGKNFKMVSGHGDSWISIFNVIGDQHCHREVVLALGEVGSSSKITGKHGKEGPSFRIRKPEAKRSAEEGPSNQSWRTSNQPKGLSIRKKSKKGPSNMIELEEFASNDRKVEEETMLFQGRTLSDGKETDTGLSNSSGALGKEHSLTPKVLSSSTPNPQPDGKEMDLAGPLSLYSGTATEAVLIHGKNEEADSEVGASNDSSEEESPNVLEKPSDSRQGDDGPER